MNHQSDTSLEIVARGVGDGQPREATAFVRPHDIEVLREEANGALSATVRYVRAIGPVVRVELGHQTEVIEVPLSRERQQQLGLVNGDAVWLVPKQVTVFGENGGAGRPNCLCGERISMVAPGPRASTRKAATFSQGVIAHSIVRMSALPFLRPNVMRVEKRLLPPCG